MTIPYGVIAGALAAGDVVPFLGAGASAGYRPSDQAVWCEGEAFLPFGSELASHLARACSFPDPSRQTDLALVSSYYEYVAADRQLLQNKLRTIFEICYQPGGIHRLLATIPHPLLIITTNYDDLMERSFGDRPYHLVVDRGDHKRMWVAGRERQLEPVRSGDLRRALQPEDWPILYKLHGYVHPEDHKKDNFLITEQDYVDFLGRPSSCSPAYLKSRMMGARFLFLGYSLADWNVRVLLRKLRQQSRGKSDAQRSWAINRSPRKAEQKIWEAHGVNVYDEEVRAFAEELAKELGILIGREHSDG